MTTEIVYSPVQDKNIKNDIKNSPIWKKCYHENEITDEIRMKHHEWYVYHVKFDGLLPIQITKIIKQ